MRLHPPCFAPSSFHHLLAALTTAAACVLVFVNAAGALAPLSTFTLTVDGAPAVVAEPVRGEYDFPYKLASKDAVYYIESDAALGPHRAAFLQALEAGARVTLHGEVWMLDHDLLMFHAVTSLQTAR